MTVGEWLVLVQTVILFLTGVVVAWYSWETRRIRQETALQSRLLAEQVRLLAAEQHRAEKKELSYVRPVFIASGSTSSADESQFRFTNKGGPIQNISAEGLGREAKVSPHQYVGTGEGLKVTVRPGSLPGLQFKLSYDTALGREATTFRHLPDENRWQFDSVDA